MLEKINKYIHDYYQISFTQDILTYREKACATIQQSISFDTISWNYITADGRNLGVICAPEQFIQNQYSVSSNVKQSNNLIPLLDTSVTSMVAISGDGMHLTAINKATKGRKGHKITLSRHPEQHAFNQQDLKTLELITPHIVESFSMALMNNFNEKNADKAVAFIDANDNIIEASSRFTKLFSTVIKRNKICLDSNVYKQQTLTIDGIELTLKVKSLSDLYFIEVFENIINKLTNQERKIMRILATGASNKDIAMQLQLSPSTINNHLNNIFDKLKVNSRISAVKLWNFNVK